MQMNIKKGDIPIVKAFVHNGNYYVYDTCKNQLLSVTREQYVEIIELLHIGITKYKALNKDSKTYTDILMLINKGFFIKHGLVEEFLNMFKTYKRVTNVLHFV